MNSVLAGLTWSTYTQQQVVPNQLVAARKDAITGALVAGLAAPGIQSKDPATTSLGDVVDVTKAWIQQGQPPAWKPEGWFTSAPGYRTPSRRPHAVPLAAFRSQRHPGNRFHQC